jgi:hypothetical protein
VRVEEQDGFPVCLADFPAIVSQGQAFVIGTGLLLGLTALLLYRYRTRGSRYRIEEG